MLIIKFFVVATILLLVYQDFKDRSVYAMIFPVLIIFFVLMRWLTSEPLVEILLSTAQVTGFMILQLFILALFFSFRQRRWTWVVGEALGWGDVCLLLAFCFYFSLLNFIAFYLLSTLLTIILWVVGKSLFKPSTQHIPLAGLQAVFFLAVFFLNAIWPTYSPQDDYYILRLIR